MSVGPVMVRSVHAGAWLQCGPQGKPGNTQHRGPFKTGTQTRVPSGTRRSLVGWDATETGAEGPSHGSQHQGGASAGAGLDRGPLPGRRSCFSASSTIVCLARPVCVILGRSAAFHRLRKT